MDSTKNPRGTFVGAKVDLEECTRRFKLLAQSGEEVKGVFGGAVIEGDGHAHCGTGKHFLIVTNERAIFSAGEPPTEENTDFWVYADITGAEAKKGLITGDVILTVKAAKKQFGFMQKTEADTAVALIREQIKA
ncbi:MAG: hypothetical protein APR53_04175 [Methanoculleus sp. SDB]|nr:MAG: hypothetical protein APR53_04175 [Methanoculleus sp. SDB]